MGEASVMYPIWLKSNKITLKKEHDQLSAAVSKMLLSVSEFLASLFVWVITTEGNFLYIILSYTFAAIAPIVLFYIAFRRTHQRDQQEETSLFIAARWTCDEFRDILHPVVKYGPSSGHIIAIFYFIHLFILLVASYLGFGIYIN